MAEPIEMSFGVWSWRGEGWQGSTCVLDGGRDPSCEVAI